MDIRRLLRWMDERWLQFDGFENRTSEWKINKHGWEKNTSDRWMERMTLAGPMREEVKGRVPGVVVHELGVLLSPFSSSKGFCGCSSWRPPAKNAWLSHWLQSSSFADRSVLRASPRKMRPRSVARLRSVSIRGDDMRLCVGNDGRTFSVWYTKHHTHDKQWLKQWSIF